MLAAKTIAIREDGCFSALLWNGRPFAVSLERTFEEARPVLKNGIYICKRSFFNKGGYETFEIMYSGHSKILFHKGNLETDSEACVLVAESFGVLKDQTAVLDSKGGFNEFMDLTRGLQEFPFEVMYR